MVKKNFYELTNPQKNIYLREEYYPNTSINNISFTYYFEKDLNPEICVKAINKIILAHGAEQATMIFEYPTPIRYVKIRK